MQTSERIKSLIHAVANSDMDYKDKEDITITLKMDLNAMRTYEKSKELIEQGAFEEDKQCTV